MADQLTDRRGVEPTAPANPWPALWAMVIGFFMILVDSTIVTIATPAIRESLNTDYNNVIWVTSAYLLAYAVPLLITGRLGDRVGPRNIYLIGLAIFTAASLWCGLTHSIGMLITARVVQGLGASLMTPQTMAVITRTFPPSSRGKAMGLWGATAGVATLVGPILGGVLVDGPGWEWIFFINVPVGVIGLVLAWRLVPALETHTHKFDWLGVALSAAAMFLVVFGIQEGQRYDWGTITGWISVPLLIVLGVLLFVVFIVWQAVNRQEPLVPLSLFKDRNFSLSNAAIACVSFCITAFAFPFTLWAQTVRGWTPTQSALLMVPMAVFTGFLAPLVGKLIDKGNPRVLICFGFLAGAVSLVWLKFVMTTTSQVWQILLPIALFGIGSAFLWAPLAATATRNLPVTSAGAGSGVYNATRQVGAVLGSAAIASVISSRLAANLGPMASAMDTSQEKPGVKLPAQIADPFSTAMAQSILLPAAALILGFLLALFLAGPTRRRGAHTVGKHAVGSHAKGAPAAAASAAGGGGTGATEPIATVD